jgi:hypothetical protein
MSSEEARDNHWHRCPTSTRLTVAESARLAALPTTVDPVNRAVLCELAAGHNGSHVAFTVAGSGGQRWWWLIWTANVRTLLEADPCDRTQQHGLQRDECLLPYHHPGPHTFDIRATLWTRKRRTKRPTGPWSAGPPTGHSVGTRPGSPGHTGPP